MKKCCMCKQELPEEQFKQNKRRKDGLQSQCIACHQQYRRQHYLDNKAKYISKAKVQTQKVIHFVWQLKSSTPCADCGKYYPPYVMDFDHQGKKEFNIAAGVSRKGFLQVQQEISKCEIVCANCHRERTFKPL